MFGGKEKKGEAKREVKGVGMRAREVEKQQRQACAITLPSQSSTPLPGHPLTQTSLSVSGASGFLWALKKRTHFHTGTSG